MGGVLRGRGIKPMKATSGKLPTGDDWVYELKWDGMRIVSFLDADGLRLQSANQIDTTASFPELEALGDALAGFDSLILDGEVVAFGDDGNASFGRLQERMHVRDRDAALRRAAATPVVYVVFDVLHVNGTDTMNLPFTDRRRLLERIVESGPSWRVTELHEDGASELLAVVTEHRIEGLIAKRKTSHYLEGRRSTEWRKIKPRLRQEFVVGGWAEGREGRVGAIGSLLIGVFADGGLVSTGSVGSGLDASALDEWKARVETHRRDLSPFTGPQPPTLGRTFHWIDPVFVIEVAFGEWTADGNLRHPTYLGLRADKDPNEVVREA